MKKAAKIIGYILLILVVLSGISLTYVKFGLPDVGDAPDIKVEITPQRIERGAYLANNVTVCMDCHSGRKWTVYAAPLDDSKLGAGGEVFNKDMGFPGEFIAPNITPYHLKNWSDGEIYRAITSGVSKDGHALFPIMPYPNFARMDKEDIYSLIAYVRTLPEKESQPGPSKADFPMNFIINTIPAPSNHQKVPSPNDQIAYGGYLVNAASCNDCHSKKIEGKEVEGMHFAGGFEFNFPNGTVTSSANITPDKETGIGNWTKEQFVSRFKTYSDSTYKAPTLEANGFQTPMPWMMYTGMKTSDLEAIYAYLRTLSPIKNQVSKFAVRNK